MFLKKNYIYNKVIKFYAQLIATFFLFPYFFFRFEINHETKYIMICTRTKYMMICTNTCNCTWYVISKKKKNKNILCMLPGMNFFLAFEHPHIIRYAFRSKKKHKMMKFIPWPSYFFNDTFFSTIISGG